MTAVRDMPWYAPLRRLPRGLDGTAFWLAVWFVVLWVLRVLLPGSLGTLAGVLQVMAGLALAVVAVPVIWRQVRQRMLWSLRNRLVLTYLLIGLAPVVLFLTLVTVAAYIAAGQFAIHVVDNRLQTQLDELTSENAVDVRRVAELLRVSAPAATAEGSVPLEPSALPRGMQPQLTAFLAGVPLEVASARRSRTPLGLPPWAQHLPGDRFRGMVLDAGELYLVAMGQIRIVDGRTLSLVSSVPVGRELMDLVSRDLGRAGIVGLTTGDEQGLRRSARSRQNTSAQTRAEGTEKTAAQTKVSGDEVRRTSVFGGAAPESANVLDFGVRFLSTLPVTDWDTGEPDNVPVQVESRPSRLYQTLFGASLKGEIARIIRISLLVLCALFALIEILALTMAVRLSRTITASVSGLYEATLRIDHGDFDHRIGVTQNDQLADLSRSFNRMTGSLQRLLVEQKEKERLQNEISIAQEVQANLFPQKAFDLPSLELHGICRPARSVSGDYYDFLLFEQEHARSNGSERVTGVGIAIGDISGKGISAALLMATLHSAVRAYRLASEELLLANGEGATRFKLTEDGCTELFESPGRILSLLNRHLYRSTQPEKYATLFLAHYDAASARLTYSNAGQLPPLVLGRDGMVRRLDRGGTVVGLLDGMSYEEDRLVLEPGDIMVAYSDGVTEPENDFGDFGEERMMEVVRRYRDEPLHVISSQVMQALDAWIGAEEQPDDITLVLARRI